MTKNETVDLLKSQLPGFYSVEQVINLIDKIEEEQAKPKLSVDQLRDITSSIMNAIEEEAQRDNIVCLEDVEFELGWDRRIEVRDVPINFDAIRDCVESELTEYFEEEEEEDEVSSSEYTPVEDNE
jgi:hypothetical protein